ncbi:MAG: endonuclease/exonuclease/phosphatase family protein [Candidatus Hydrogenedentes bacterium]|nr:endonuclease/exonuclease/phosphatase family protein [Candidatus Hydrogenedentota bacterium]
MDRREFIETSGVLGAALTLSGVSPGKTTPETGITSITYNILACREHPDTDTNRHKRTVAGERMAERLALELALYQPDLVTFQESPSEAVVAEVARELGFHYGWFPGGWPGNADWPGGFPGTIMSRFPIKDNANRPAAKGIHDEELFTRHWCSATLETAQGPLRVFSAHLHPQDAAIRAREITAILEVLDGVLATGESLLFQGDLNHSPDGPEYERWVAAGLVDTLAVATGKKDTPTFSSTEPKERIDYIWAGGPIASRIRESRVLFEGAFRTNPEDPTSFALSDHVPVLARFGG